MKNDMITTGAHAFLFNADTPELGGYYGYPCDRALFSAILESSKIENIISRIYIGDLLLHNLCTKIHKINASSDKNYSISTSYTIDEDLYTAVVTDVASSIKERWNTFDNAGLPIVLARNNIYCIVLSELPYETRETIDRLVKKLKGYLGVFELDLGNPLHNQLFFSSLIFDYYLEESVLYYQQDLFSDDIDIPHWAQENENIKVNIIEYHKFISVAPPLTLPNELSERGKVSLKLLQNKGKSDHYQQIARELSHSLFTRSECKDELLFTIESNFSFKNIIIPEKKLTEYALNLEHTGTGKNKAILFRDLLGITKESWKHLAVQLVEGLSNGKIQRIRKTEYGIQYHIDIPILGLNTASKTVRSAWITKDNVTIQLISVYIADKANQLDEVGIPPAIIDNEIQGTERWKLLYQLAHSEAIKASEETIPTPMYIAGYPNPEMEGECGSASIIIKDTRKGFAKWLKDNHIGHRHYKPGWEIHVSMKSQSVQRARAYAETFEKILKFNDVECYSSYKLD